MRFQINDKKTLIQDRTILLSWPPFRLLAKTNQKKHLFNSNIDYFVGNEFACSLIICSSI